nr:PREDICTED: C-type lectin domain family 6 member A-like [Latimeria chalumnae]|eukprot:XP_014354148.1 PREDICTED: C-type lectin domain family 6 member A-like [Latimeria chalumnae]
MDDYIVVTEDLKTDIKRLHLEYYYETICCCISYWKCCPRDWLYFGGSCYFFSNNAMTWVSSKENCTSLGAHLVVITSKEEQIFIQEQLVVQKLKVVYWIGLNDMTMEGNWQWVDGTAYKEHL